MHTRTLNHAFQCLSLNCCPFLCFAGHDGLDTSCDPEGDDTFDNNNNLNATFNSTFRNNLDPDDNRTYTNHDEQTCHTPERGGSIDSTGNTPIHFESALGHSPERAPKCANKTHNHDKYIGTSIFVATYFAASISSFTPASYQHQNDPIFLTQLCDHNIQAWEGSLRGNVSCATCATRPTILKTTPWWPPATAAATQDTCMYSVCKNGTRPPSQVRLRDLPALFSRIL